MPTINEMIDFCEDMAAYDCFSNEQFARREMFYAISDELKKSLREQKRPHGEWILDAVAPHSISWFRCSHCGYKYEAYKQSNFCPSCGTPMNEIALEILSKRGEAE